MVGILIGENREAIEKPPIWSLSMLKAAMTDDLSHDLMNSSRHTQSRPPTKRATACEDPGPVAIASKSLAAFANSCNCADGDCHRRRLGHVETNRSKHTFLNQTQAKSIPGYWWTIWWTVAEIWYVMVSYLVVGGMDEITLGSPITCCRLNYRTHVLWGGKIHWEQPLPQLCGDVTLWRWRGTAKYLTDRSVLTLSGSSQSVCHCEKIKQFNLYLYMFWCIINYNFAFHWFITFSIHLVY